MKTIAMAFAALGVVACTTGAPGTSAAPATRACAGRDTGHTSGGIYFECAGSGTDVVILFPAFSMDTRMWAPQIAVLRPLARVITYDLRAHGKTTAPLEPYSTSDDLAALMHELSVDRAHLVGLSNGARIALDFGLVHPEMVESLVLASPGVGGFTGGDFSYMQPVIAAARQGDLTKAAEEWANTPLMAIPTDSAAWALVRRISVDNRALWGIRANPERPLTPPAVQRLTEVRVPVLVISGERDVPLIRLVADSVAKTIPGARQASIPNVGHMANLADPDAFNRVLLRFLPIRK